MGEMEELRAKLLTLEAEFKKVLDAKADAADAVARESLGKLEKRLEDEIRRLGGEFTAELGKLTPPAPAAKPAEKGVIEELLEWLGL